MAYTNRTIRLDFPELGDDIWVVINNPMLMPASRLQSDIDIKVGEDGKPIDPKQAITATFDIASKLVQSWNVYDPFDETDTPMELPATIEKLQLLPMTITLRISEIVGKALNPQK
jgi:hypothetical protein